MSVIDGNALFHSITTLPETFGELALAILKSFPKSKNIHFITDSYIPSSIKAAERERRGISEMHAQVIHGPLTKLPKNWKAFLSNDTSKTNLIEFLLREWEGDIYAPYLQDRFIFVVCGGSCTLLSSEDGMVTNTQPVNDLNCAQEEADTKIIFHCQYISRQNPSTPIIVRSPVTDVFILLLAFAENFDNTLLFDTGTGNNRQLLNISKLSHILPKNMCQALLGFHSFTGCDTTSSFSGKGKVRPLKILQKHEEMIHFFIELGQSGGLDESVYSGLEKFVCMMYGYTTSENVNKVRCDIVRKRFTPGDDRPLSYCKGIDLSQLPPCQSSLQKHIKRAHYQAQIWRQAKENKEIPNPDQNGWKTTAHGSFVID